MSTKQFLLASNIELNSITQNKPNQRLFPPRKNSSPYPNQIKSTKSQRKNNIIPSVTTSYNTFSFNSCCFSTVEFKPIIWEKEMIRKKKKTCPTIKCKLITEDQVKRVLHLSQLNAAKMLSCSLSALKRKFNELKDSFGLKKWPRNIDRLRHLPIFKQVYPMSLSFILNQDNNIQ